MTHGIDMLVCRCCEGSPGLVSRVLVICAYTLQVNEFVLHLRVGTEEGDAAGRRVREAGCIAAPICIGCTVIISTGGCVCV
jgi:hypothetical protein